MFCFVIVRFCQCSVLSLCFLQKNISVCFVFIFHFSGFQRARWSLSFFLVLHFSSRAGERQSRGRGRATEGKFFLQAILYRQERFHYCLLQIQSIQFGMINFVRNFHFGLKLFSLSWFFILLIVTSWFFSSLSFLKFLTIFTLHLNGFSPNRIRWRKWWNNRHNQSNTDHL